MTGRKEGEERQERERQRERVRGVPTTATARARGKPTATNATHDEHIIPTRAHTHRNTSPQRRTDQQRILARKNKCTLGNTHKSKTKN